MNIEKIRITTLSENSVADIYYVAEWGLSVHISIEGGLSILFDTGFRQACTYNADVAGIRLSNVDIIVLSHGHSDHTGGLRSVLQQIKYEKPDRSHVDILCHPAAIEPQYVKHTDHYFYRGCPHHIEELIRLGARFKTSSEPTWLTEDIVVSGEVPMKTNFESVAPICFSKRNGQYVSSSVDDDQALFFKTNRGLLVIAGCAHRGIINTIMHARALFGMDKVFMVIGGTHLLNTSCEQQEKTTEALKAFGVKKIGVSHCTGMKPAGYLSEQLGPERFFFNNAGTRITFPNEKIKVDAFEKYKV
ncbi:MAG: MBL fold metallo-hydrolase [Deltaproteobacteria bacterium]|nr:MBL fold metallo-hydrolase [Deltaproteobacteria bacterium]